MALGPGLAYLWRSYPPAWLPLGPLPASPALSSCSLGLSPNRMGLLGWAWLTWGSSPTR